MLRNFVSRLNAEKLSFWMSVFASFVWVAYLFAFKAGVPTGDDLNFFLPNLLSADSAQDGDYLLLPQGPHFHFSYKLLSAALLEWTGYNTLLFSATGPFVLIVLVHLVFRYLGGAAPSVNPAAMRFEGMWSAIFALLIVLVVFTPMRSVDFTYDMLALNGNLAYVTFIGALLCMVLYARREIGHIAIAIAIVAPVVIFGVTTFKTFYFAGLIALVMVALPDLYRRVAKLDFSGVLNAHGRLGVIFGLVTLCWIAYDAVLGLAGYRQPDGEALQLSAMIGWVRSGIYQSLGGGATLGTLGLEGQAELVRSALLLVVAVGAVAITPFLIWKRHAFVLALMGSLVLAALGAGLLRGTVEAPRYQGIFSFFWLGVVMTLALSVREIWLNRAEWSSRWERVVHWSALGGAAMLTSLCLVAMVVQMIYLDARLPSARRYMARQAEVFYGHTVLTDADARALHCRRPLDQCQAVIDYVREARGVRLTPGE